MAVIICLFSKWPFFLRIIPAILVCAVYPSLQHPRCCPVCVKSLANWFHPILAEFCMFLHRSEWTVKSNNFTVGSNSYKTKQNFRFVMNSVVQKTFTHKKQIFSIVSSLFKIHFPSFSLHDGHSQHSPVIPFLREFLPPQIQLFSHRKPREIFISLLIPDSATGNLSFPSNFPSLQRK